MEGLEKAMVMAMAMAMAMAMVMVMAMEMKVPNETLFRHGENIYGKILLSYFASINIFTALSLIKKRLSLL